MKNNAELPLVLTGSVVFVGRRPKSPGDYQQGLLTFQPKSKVSPALNLYIYISITQIAAFQLSCLVQTISLLVSSNFWGVFVVRVNHNIFFKLQIYSATKKTPSFLPSQLHHIFYQEKTARVVPSSVANCPMIRPVFRFARFMSPITETGGGLTIMETATKWWWLVHLPKKKERDIHIANTKKTIPRCFFQHKTQEHN